MQEEFSLEVNFLKHAFPLLNYPKYDCIENLNVLTTGSCFANNISKYINYIGGNANSLPTQEYLNTPISLLTTLMLAKQDKNTFVNSLLNIFGSTSQNKDEISAYIDKEYEYHQKILDKIRSANVLIITGNTLEWSHTCSRNLVIDFATGLKCFYSRKAGIKESIRKDNTSRVHAPFLITKKSICDIFDELDDIFNGDVFVTISPIPVNGFIDHDGASSCSAITENTICKSMLRAALHEAMSERKEKQNIYYFPSYEISTEVQSRIPDVGYGNDDSVSRHLDNRIVHSICEFFLWKLLGQNFSSDY